jgi:hypothetical protein
MGFEGINKPEPWRRGRRRRRRRRRRRINIPVVLEKILLYFCVRFEVFTAVTKKNAVFWDVTPCGSCNDLRFGGT